MVKRVNIMVGRFQPFTNGHMKCVEYAYSQTGLPTVLAMIYTSPEKVDERHPFNSDLMFPIYHKMFDNNPMIADIITVRNANIVSIGQELYKNGYEIASWTCGTDRLESYQKMADKYKDKSHLTDDFQMLEVKRSDEDISATKARQALLDNDEKTFKKLTPLLSLKTRLLLSNDLFTILREEILKIHNK